MKNLAELVQLSLVAFVLLSFRLIAGWRPYTIQHYNVSAYSLSDKVFLNASIVNVERVSIYFEVKSEIQQMFIRFEIYVDSGDGLIDLKYMNETIDLCRLLNVRSYKPFVQILYRVLTDQGNYPTSCPIKKKQYIAENTKLDMDKLPSTLPSKTLSVAAIGSMKEGPVMTPLFFYKIIVKVVNTQAT